MKRILQIGMTSNYGGIESFIMNLYRNINRDKFQFDFVNMELDGKNIAYSNEIKNLGGNIYNIPGRKENFFRNRKELKDILINNEYDFVDNNILTWSYSEGITLPMKYTNSKVIVHSHNSNMNEGLITRRILNSINKRLNNRQNLIRLACSEEAGLWLFDKKKFEVIPNGIETSKFHFDLDIRNKYREKFNLKDKKVYLHVGRLSHQKNHEYLLKWFNGIHRKDCNTILFLVGEGELHSYLRKRVRELNLQTCVKFLGIRQDIRDLMFMSDVFLFPSLYEGLGIVLIEAQATGLPCLVSDRIQKEAKITPLVKTINILENPKKYVDLALNTRVSNEKRLEAMTLVKKAGYDISNTVKLMERIYSN